MRRYRRSTGLAVVDTKEVSQTVLTIKKLTFQWNSEGFNCSLYDWLSVQRLDEE